jgi:hypothetical protein
VKCDACAVDMRLAEAWGEPDTFAPRFAFQAWRCPAPGCEGQTVITPAYEAPKETNA